MTTVVIHIEGVEKLINKINVKKANDRSEILCYIIKIAVTDLAAIL